MIFWGGPSIFRNFTCGGKWFFFSRIEHIESINKCTMKQLPQFLRVKSGERFMDFFQTTHLGGIWFSLQHLSKVYKNGQCRKHFVRINQN